MTSPRATRSSPASSARCLGDDVGKPNTITRLPAEIRELIADLRDHGRTIDEILAKLRELQVGVSRSALGRHTRELDAIAADLRKSRAIADAIVEGLGVDPDNRTARLNVQLMHSQIMRLLTPDDDGAVTLDATGASQIATALQRLASAEGLDAARTLKLRKELATKAASKAEIAVKEATERHGFKLPAETLKVIREQVYGIVDHP